MSIFKEVWNDLKKKQEHNGVPYSIDEILSMDDEELGAEYSIKSFPNQKYSKKTIDFFAVCIKTLKTIIILSIIAILVTLMITDPAAFEIVVTVAFFPAAVVLSILWNVFEDWFELDYCYEAPYLFTNIMIDDFDALVDETTSESGGVVNSDNTSKFCKFIDRMKRIKDFNHKYLYSNKDKGKLLKIIAPLASLHHDGVTINDHVYNKLDEQLDLSGRSEELLEQMEKYKKTDELIKEEDASRKARIEARRSDSKVDSMVSMINQYKTKQAILEGSSDYKRIVNLKNQMEYNSNIFDDRIKG